MTVRQLFVFGAAAGSVGSAITFKGSASATATTVSIPSHAADDMIVITACNNTGSSITIPAGWTEINSISETLTRSRVAYKKAASGGETSGTWTGAINLLVGVWDGVASIGAAAEQASSHVAYFPTLSMTVKDGTSWVVGIDCHNYLSYPTNITTPPDGMTHRAYVTNSNAAAIALNDSASGISAWNVKSVHFTYSTSIHGYTFEMVSE